VIEPEIGHHFLKLPFAFDRAHDFVGDQLLKQLRRLLQHIGRHELLDFFTGGGLILGVRLFALNSDLSGNLLRVRILVEDFFLAHAE
jgi:hypothetical protein